MAQLFGISLLAVLCLLLPSCSSQPVRTLDSPLTLPEPRTSGHTGHSVATRDTQLKETISFGIGYLADRITAQLAESLKPLEHLKDLQNLETISEKLQSPEELRETVDSGLRRISDSLLSRAKIDNTLGLGLEQISEKIGSINSLGLTKLASEVNGLKPYNSPTGISGHLPSISTELRGIMDKISDHGDKISNHLTKTANSRDNYDQQINERIITAVNNVASTLDSGHQDVVQSVADGNKGVADAIDTGREHLLEALRARFPGKVAEINESLTATLANILSKRPVS